jgi:predicted nucleic acid-binding protein
MQVLLDTNVVMDYLVKREPFLEDAERVILLIVNKKVDGFVSAHTICDLIYILRKYLEQEGIREVLVGLCSIFTVINVDKIKLLAALQNNLFNDIEDCLQMECAKAAGVDYIVTRNINDYKYSTIPVIAPKKFLEGKRYV